MMKLIENQPPAQAGPMFSQPQGSVMRQLAELLTPQSMQPGGGGAPFSLSDMMTMSNLMNAQQKPGGLGPLPAGSIVGADAPQLPQGAGASYGVA